MRLPGALPDAPCAQCGRKFPGVGWGDLCPECKAVRVARARKLSSRISLLATALMGLYVMLRVPSQPLARTYAVVAVVATYILVRRIAMRLALEFLPRQQEGR